MSAMMLRFKEEAWISRTLTDRSANFMQIKDTASVETGVIENTKRASDSPMVPELVQDVARKGISKLNARRIPCVAS